MKQQQNQMNQLMETMVTAKKDASRKETPGSNYIGQQRERLDSLSKNHKLDDDMDVFEDVVDNRNRNVQFPLHLK